MTTTGLDRTATPGKFFTTVPGVLTAIAALVTAVGGVYGAYLASHQQPVVPPVVVATVQPNPTPAPEPTPVDPPPPDPADAGVLPDDATIDDATDVLGTDLTEDDSALARWYAALDIDSQIVVDDCIAGDDDSCTAVASALVDGCDTGTLLACDAVYEVADVGSELEDFGATCGARIDDWTYAGECAA